MWFRNWAKRGSVLCLGELGCEEQCHVVWELG